MVSKDDLPTVSSTTKRFILTATLLAALLVGAFFLGYSGTGRSEREAFENGQARGYREGKKVGKREGRTAGQKDGEASASNPARTSSSAAGGPDPSSEAPSGSSETGSADSDGSAFDQGDRAIDPSTDEPTQDHPRCQEPEPPLACF